VKDDGRDTITPLELTRLLPYVALIRGAVHAIGCRVITPWLLAAIAYRETHCGFAPGYSPKGSPFGLGDGGHGYGLWQLDDRWNLQRIARVKAARKADGDEAALRLMAREALYVLIEKYAHLIDERRPRPLKGAEARRAMIAAYNAGQGPVYSLIQAGQNPDSCTTGGNYSAWVLAKEAALQAAAPTLFDLHDSPKGATT
jgi:hypothetical protein